jgi:hypothetical protein
MSTRRALGIGLLVAGAALLIFGLDSSGSLTNEISQTFTGAPTDRTMWMIVGGVGCAAVGAMLAIVPGRSG